MNKKCTEAVKHKEEAVNKCDHQMAEMMATLEKYQQENHKIVTQKDKEIEQLKLKLETESSSNKKEVTVFFSFIYFITKFYVNFLM